MQNPNKQKSETTPKRHHVMCSRTVPKDLYVTAGQAEEQPLESYDISDEDGDEDEEDDNEDTEDATWSELMPLFFIAMALYCSPVGPARVKALGL